MRTQPWRVGSDYARLHVCVCKSECGKTATCSEVHVHVCTFSVIGMEHEFATPCTSPSKRPSSYHNSSLDTPPPMFKKQRLFSPSSPKTPDNKLSSPFHRSKVLCRRSPSPCNFSFNSSTDSYNGEAMGHVNESGCGMDSDDIMVCSPPKEERLQLFDYPRTPLSIVRSSGLQMPGDHSVVSVQPKQSKFIRRYVLWIINVSHVQPALCEKLFWRWADYARLN